MRDKAEGLDNTLGAEEEEAHKIRRVMKRCTSALPVIGQVLADDAR